MPAYGPMPLHVITQQSIAIVPCPASTTAPTSLVTFHLHICCLHHGQSAIDEQLVWIARGASLHYITELDLLRAQPKTDLLSSKHVSHVNSGLLQAEEEQAMAFSQASSQPPAAFCAGHRAADSGLQQPVSPHNGVQPADSSSRHHASIMQSSATSPQQQQQQQQLDVERPSRQPLQPLAGAAPGGFPPSMPQPQAHHAGACAPVTCLLPASASLAIPEAPANI